MFYLKSNISLVFIFFLCSIAFSQSQNIHLNNLGYKLYPEVNEKKPELPSPFRTTDNQEYIIAFTKEQKFAIIPVTLTHDHGMCKQLVVDTLDFPHLAKTGLHLEENLNKIRTITHRSLEEITELGRPNGLSHDGFMAKDENIISVMKADNHIVSQLGLTHPQMAKPLFYILNMMDIDLSLNRWNRAKHRWENIQYIYYNGHKVFVDAQDSKGGQLSIFDDNIEGAFYIKIWREMEEQELHYLKEKYELNEAKPDTLIKLLCSIHTGEMEPQYIMRYGFYEGHTFWRTDPIAIAFIFGLKSIEEIEQTFSGKLDEILVNHFTE